MNAPSRRFPDRVERRWLPAPIHAVGGAVGPRRLFHRGRRDPGAS